MSDFSHKPTNDEILNTALIQSAKELNCLPEDFLSGKSKVTLSKSHDEARKYIKQPFFCNIVSYGKNAVATADERVIGFAEEYLSKFSTEHLFETPAIHLLIREFGKYGFAPCFMAEYFLPDINILKPLECGFEMKVLYEKDFADLYKPQFSNALCKERSELDRIAVAAYDNGEIIALAGASADCDSMWQIGIDVLPEYRRRGIASALTSTLAVEILKRGKIPFYCAAWSNIGSVKNAVKSGFRPAWCELTSVEIERIDDMLKKG